MNCNNLYSIFNSFQKIGYKTSIIKNSKNLKKFDHIVLPGVGSFDWAMKKLEDSGFKEKLNDLVINKKIPFLGICIGMQIISDRSEEGSLNYEQVCKFYSGISWENIANYIVDNFGLLHLN